MLLELSLRNKCCKKVMKAERERDNRNEEVFAPRALNALLVSHDKRVSDYLSE